MIIGRENIKKIKKIKFLHAKYNFYYYYFNVILMLISMKFTHIEEAGVF